MNVTVKDKRLFDYGKTLLDSLHWHGPAQVEVKLDLSDNNYKLLEVNPKFWGTLDLSIKCGVNFPEIALNLALYGKQQTAVSQNFGAALRYRWLSPFIKAHRAAGISRVGVIRRLINRVEYSDLDCKDFGPTLYYILLAVINLFGNNNKFQRIR